MRDTILVNHVGFTPRAHKVCVILYPPEQDFSMWRLKDTFWTLVYRAPLQAGGAELGPGWVGDFSSVQREGIYQLRCGDLYSRCFVIHRHVYDVPLRVLYTYFPWQRCGDTHQGWASPCHLGDGRIADTNQHIDLGGGYHQSSDLRKWPPFVNLGLMGLVHFGLVLSPHWDEGEIADEIRWGSDYYQKLVKEDGGLYDSVFIPLGWSARDYYLNDAPPPAQWNTIRYQAMVACYFADREPAVAAACITIAKRVWEHMTASTRPQDRYQSPALPPRGHGWINTYCYRGFYQGSALHLAHRLVAAISLYRVTQDQGYLDDASQSASALASWQVAARDRPDDIAGCFWEGDASDRLADSYFYFWHNSGPLGLCDVLELRPNHPDAERWLRALQGLAEQHRQVARRNPYGLVATRWYTSPTAEWRGDPFFGNHATVHAEGQYPGGVVRGRSGATERYCYYDYYAFLYNMDIMAVAVFLRRAARLTGNTAYAHLAQRQLDWVLGCNPFDASAVEGVGYNQPHRGLYGEFFPPTPQIPGAVSTGISPESLAPSRYGISNEYDMPAVGWVMWLMADLAAEARDARQ